jgi:hypothetical protein
MCYSHFSATRLTPVSITSIESLPIQVIVRYPAIPQCDCNRRSHVGMASSQRWPGIARQVPISVKRKKRTEDGQIDERQQSLRGWQAL